jgi:hypothetical protein
VYNFGDNGIAPDGTNKAQFQGIVSTTNSIYRYIDYGGSTGYRTFSIFAKDAGDVGSGYALLRIGEETSPAKRYGIIVDLSDGSVTDEESGNSPANTSYQVDNIGNGWYRIALTLNSGSTSNFRVAIAPYGNSTWSSEGGSVLTPDNAGGTVGTGVLFWGTQIEAGAFPTSYIPTSGSTVTRSAEAAYIGIDSWYPYSSGGTVIVEGRVAEVSSDNMYLEGSLNGSGIYDISVTAAQTRSQFINRYVNASNDMRSPNSTISAGELVRLVCAWSATETNSYLDGAATSSIANQSFSVGANRIYFGSRNGSSLFVNEALKRVAFYPQRLSNDTLQAMTEE